MTSPKIMKYWRKNIKNKYLILFGFYLNQEKYAFLKIAFQAQINVHLVRLIFRGRGKFISGFLESVQYLFSFFFCTTELFQKKVKPTRAVTGRPSTESPPPGLFSLRRRRPLNPPLLFVPGRRRPRPALPRRLGGLRPHSRPSTPSQVDSGACPHPVPSARQAPWPNDNWGPPPECLRKLCETKM